MNTQESPDFPFYGTVYATGNALLTGNAQDGLDANIAMTTNRNTNFTYSTGTVASATNNQFIKFVDKTPRRSIHFGRRNSGRNYENYYGSCSRRLYQRARLR